MQHFCTQIPESIRNISNNYIIIVFLETLPNCFTISTLLLLNYMIPKSVCVNCGLYKLHIHEMFLRNGMLMDHVSLLL